MTVPNFNTTKNVEKTMQDLSPFYIWTTQLEASRTVPERQFFRFHPTIFERHPSLNSSRGVITTHSLDGIFDGIQSCLAEKCVLQIYKLTRMKKKKPLLLKWYFCPLQFQFHSAQYLSGMNRFLHSHMLPTTCSACTVQGWAQHWCASGIVCNVCSKTGWRGTVSQPTLH